MDQTKIGKFIAACRKEQGITQAALLFCDFYAYA